MKMLGPRWKWLVIPLAFGLGAAGGAVVNRQILIRSIEARDRAKAAELALGQASKPKDAGLADQDESKMRDSGDDPFNLENHGQPRHPQPVALEEAPIKVEPPLVARGQSVELDPPPGYFDLPAPDKKDGTDPTLVKRGQIIQVEVLEALPGRPITGERLVRPDGTIGLGFYGDLQVAGLNRYQIKAKLLEHLREYINDDVLGLFVESAYRTYKAIPPVASNRIFVDESVYYEPAAVKVGQLDLKTLNGQIEELNKKLNLVLEETGYHREGRRPAEVPSTTQVKPSAASTSPAPSASGRGPG